MCSKTWQPTLEKCKQTSRIGRFFSFLSVMACLARYKNLGHWTLNHIVSHFKKSCWASHALLRILMFSSQLAHVLVYFDDVTTFVARHDVIFRSCWIEVFDNFNQQHLVFNFMPNLIEFNLFEIFEKNGPVWPNNVLPSFLAWKSIWSVI